MSTRPANAHLGLRRAADLAALGAFAVALGSVLVGGFRAELFGIPVSIRNPWRPLLIGACIAGARHFMLPGPSLLRRFVQHDHAMPRPQAAGEERPASTRNLRPAAYVTCFFFAMTAAMLFPQMMQPYSVPDLGDPLFSIWRLSWVAHQLPRDPWHLFDANIFHPNPGTLAYSDAMLLPAVTAAPLLWMGIPAVLIYNLLFSSAIALSGATMCGLVRSLTGRWDAGVVAGLLFAFCAFRFLHYSHLELQMTFLMPVALYALHRTIATHRLRYGVLTGLALGLQTLSSFYYGVFFGMVLACIALILWATRHYQLRHVVKPFGAGALLTLALVAPASVPHWQARTAVGERAWGEVAFYSATARDYLTAHDRSAYRDLRARAPHVERDLFPGVVPIVLATLALWPPFSPVRLAYAGGLFFAYELSFGANGHTYRLLYDYVPPFRGFRAPARFAMLVALTMSVLAGLGLTRLLERRSPRARLAVVGIVAVLFVIEARPRLALTPVWTSPPSIYRALPVDRTVVMVDLPMPWLAQRYPIGQDLTYMYFSTFHWHRLVNGASGFYPDSSYELKEVMQEFPSAHSRALLRRYGVEYVVLHERFYSPAAYARLQSALARASDLPLVAAEAWEGTEVRLHRLLDRATSE